MENQPIRIFDEIFIKSKMELERLYQQDRPAILFVRKGSGSLSVQINKIIITENAVVLSEANSVYEIHSLSPDFEARIIVYTNDYIEKLGLKLNKLKVFKHFKTHINKNAYLPKEELDLLWSQLDIMHEILVKEVSLEYTTDIIEHLFSAFIYTLSGSLLKQERQKQNMMTRQEDISFEFIKNVFENFKEERLLQFYADKQLLTIRHLSSVVKKVTGKTANQIISEFVMNEAKILLTSSKKNIQEISESLSFSDPYSFSHFFKKHSGNSPLLYRNGSHQ